MARQAQDILSLEAGDFEMNTGLTLLSDAELDVLRVRITQMMRAGIAEQRQAVSAQLEAIDIERERRLSPRPA